MPEIWDGGTPSPTESLPASGGESELSAIGIGAYWFPTTDYRVDVGFLGSLPLSPPTKSKPVTPWDHVPNPISLAHPAGGLVHRAGRRAGHPTDAFGGLEADVYGLARGERAADEDRPVG